jgi:hypothetical protein
VGRNQTFIIEGVVHWDSLLAQIPHNARNGLWWFESFSLCLQTELQADKLFMHALFTDSLLKTLLQFIAFHDPKCEIFRLFFVRLSSMSLLQQTLWWDKKYQALFWHYDTENILRARILARAYLLDGLRAFYSAAHDGSHGEDCVAARAALIADGVMCYFLSRCKLDAKPFSDPSYHPETFQTLENNFLLLIDTLESETKIQFLERFLTDNRSVLSSQGATLEERVFLSTYLFQMMARYVIAQHPVYPINKDNFFFFVSALSIRLDYDAMQGQGSKSVVMFLEKIVIEELQEFSFLFFAKFLTQKISVVSQDASYLQLCPFVCSAAMKVLPCLGVDNDHDRMAEDLMHSLAVPSRSHILLEWGQAWDDIFLDWNHRAVFSPPREAYQASYKRVCTAFLRWMHVLFPRGCRALSCLLPTVIDDNLSTAFFFFCLVLKVYADEACDRQQRRHLAEWLRRLWRVCLSSERKQWVSWILKERDDVAEAVLLVLLSHQVPYAEGYLRNGQNILSVRKKAGSFFNLPIALYLQEAVCVGDEAFTALLLKRIFSERSWRVQRPCLEKVCSHFASYCCEHTTELKHNGAALRFFCVFLEVYSSTLHRGDKREQGVLIEHFLSQTQALWLSVMVQSSSLDYAWLKLQIQWALVLDQMRPMYANEEKKPLFYVAAESACVEPMALGSERSTRSQALFSVFSQVMEQKRGKTKKGDWFKKFLVIQHRMDIYPIFLLFFLYPHLSSQMSDYIGALDRVLLEQDWMAHHSPEEYGVTLDTVQKEEWCRYLDTVKERIHGRLQPLRALSVREDVVPLSEGDYTAVSSVFINKRDILLGQLLSLHFSLEHSSQPFIVMACASEVAQDVLQDFCAWFNKRASKVQGLRGVLQAHPHAAENVFGVSFEVKAIYTEERSFAQALESVGKHYLQYKKEKPLAKGPCQNQLPGPLIPALVRHESSSDVSWEESRDPESVDRLALLQSVFCRLFQRDQIPASFMIRIFNADGQLCTNVLVVLPKNQYDMPFNILPKERPPLAFSLTLQEVLPYWAAVWQQELRPYMPLSVSAEAGTCFSIPGSMLDEEAWMDQVDRIQEEMRHNLLAKEKKEPTYDAQTEGTVLVRPSMTIPCLFSRSSRPICRKSPALTDRGYEGIQRLCTKNMQQEIWCFTRRKDQGTEAYCYKGFSLIRNMRREYYRLLSLLESQSVWTFLENEAKKNIPEIIKKLTVLRTIWRHGQQYSVSKMEVMNAFVALWTKADLSPYPWLQDVNLAQRAFKDNVFVLCDEIALYCLLMKDYVSGPIDAMIYALCELHALFEMLREQEFCFVIIPIDLLSLTRELSILVGHGNDIDSKALQILSPYRNGGQKKEGFIALLDICREVVLQQCQGCHPLSRKLLVT